MSLWGDRNSLDCIWVRQRQRTPPRPDLRATQLAAHNWPFPVKITLHNAACALAHCATWFMSNKWWLFDSAHKRSLPQVQMWPFLLKGRCGFSPTSSMQSKLFIKAEPEVTIKMILPSRPALTFLFSPFKTDKIYYWCFLFYYAWLLNQNLKMKLCANYWVKKKVSVWPVWCLPLLPTEGVIEGDVGDSHVLLELKETRWVVLVAQLRIRSFLVTAIHWCSWHGNARWPLTRPFIHSSIVSSSHEVRGR